MSRCTCTWLACLVLRLVASRDDLLFCVVLYLMSSLFDLLFYPAFFFLLLMILHCSNISRGLLSRLVLVAGPCCGAFMTCPLHFYIGVWWCIKTGLTGIQYMDWTA